MKYQLLKKLSGFIVSAVMLSASAYAQIVYTDINPDVSITRTTIPARGTVTTEQNMDVNNDGIPDLKFTLLSSRYSGFAPGSNSSMTGSVTATPLNGSALLIDSSGNPVKLNLNKSIRANANWSTLTKQLIISKVKLTPVSVPPTIPSSTTITKGNWNTTTDGFLGLRFIAAGKTHYCWIRLNTEAFTSGPNAATLVLKDFAYNSGSGKAIRTGQKDTVAPPPISTQRTAINPNDATSMDDEISSLPSLSLYPNPAIDKFTVDLGTTNQKVDISIVDLNGKIVYSTTEAETQRLEVNTSSFEKGIYMVQIRTEDFIETKRLIVSN